MTHDEYIKRRDEILTQLENAVEHSVMSRVANRQTVSNRTVHFKAQQAIDELVLWVKDNVNQVGDDADRFEAIVKGDE